MGVVLDTSALIEVERAGSDLIDRLGELGDERAVVPAIVYAELLVGVELADSPTRERARRARVAALVDRLPVVEFDRGMAERWAELFANVTKAGTRVPSNDLIVAATAVQLGFSVLLGSKGETHFERIRGLKLIRLGGR